jgi:hypothetical protein
MTGRARLPNRRLKTMRDAVCRFDDGPPAGLAGAVLDRLCGASP